MRFRFSTAAPTVLFAAFLMIVLAASGGCEAIVSGKIAAFQDISATDSGPPPPGPDGQVEGCTPGTEPSACPDGQYCLGAGCTACDTRDVCDGYDNDCNGKVDDGPLSDHDGDGYSFCGHIDTSSGKLIDVDCDDDDPAIHPTALEVCNGKDDDCDGVIDNAELVCAASQTCVPKTGQCISDTQACTTANCPAPKVCDASTQQCVTQNGGLGTPCSGDKACTSGICGDTTVLGSISSGGGVCTKPCCTSQDCDAGFVCFGPGTGGDYCVKAESVGRSGITGTGTGGAPCGAGTDCRSGLCTANKCVDTCCSDGNCAAGTACGVTTVNGKTTLACVPPPGPVDPNAICDDDTDCRSGICAEYTDGNSIYKRCAAGCCSSTKCGAFTVNGAFGTQIQVPTTCFDDQLSGGTVALCDQPKQGSGDGDVGDACRNNGDCLSDRCGNDHFCTDSCCIDSDCGKTGWVCRPQQVGTGTYLRCVASP